jgi:hypothetical protein
MIAYKSLLTADRHVAVCAVGQETNTWMMSSVGRESRLVMFAVD